jgi:HEAT repeat protein
MTDRDPSDLSELVHRLSGADVAARIDAAERLGRAGSAAAAAALPLVRACGDADSQVRDQAVGALEELGPPPADTIGGLVDLAAASDSLVAYWAITLLGRSGEAAASAVPVLAKQLGPGSDPAVSQRAAWALGKIGPAAASESAALRQAAERGDPRLTRLAQEALSAIGG